VAGLGLGCMVAFIILVGLFVWTVVKLVNAVVGGC
jgi:hypothetical protein